MHNATSQMAAILRVCATTIRDIAETYEDSVRPSILSAAVDADRAAEMLERHASARCDYPDADVSKAGPSVQHH